jgi:hypothetical protein
LQVGEDPQAQLVHELLAEATGEADAHAARADADQDRQQVGDGDADQDAGVAVGHAVVDADLGQQRPGLQRQGLEDHQPERAQQAATVRRQEGAQAQRRVAGLPMAEVDLGLGVLGLGLEDGFDLVGQLVGHARERQAGRCALADRAAAHRAAADPRPAPAH